MKVVAAYLLASLAGNGAPSPDDIKGILSSVGADCDDEKLSLFFDLIRGKDVNELVQLGTQKFAGGGGGGGGAVVASGGGGGAAASAAAPAAEEPKKEEKKEEKEESDDDMGFSLFDP